VGFSAWTGIFFIISHMLKRVVSVLILVSAIASCATQTSKIDVIFDTDANNELDDQHAIAYLLMNPETFNTLGITTNNTKNGGGIAGQSEEARRVIHLCGDYGKGVQVFDGAEASFEEICPTLGEDSFDGAPAVNFIIDKARSYGPDKKLTLIAVGKLTNVALALARAPEIAQNLRLVWLGTNYPFEGEYNLINDIPSVNYVLDTDVELDVVTVRKFREHGTYDVRVSPDYVQTNFAGKGPQVSAVSGRHGGEFTCFGDYSVSLYNNINLNPDGTRSLYDMCAVAIVKNPSWAVPEQIPAPVMQDSVWVDRPDNQRKITLWGDFDRDAILGDFINTLK